MRKRRFSEEQIARIVREAERGDQTLADAGLTTAMATPDPHAERWLLVDAKAFRDALGTGCRAPGQKCAKDRYRDQLRAAVREAGVEPLLGGLEHAEALIAGLDLRGAARNDRSLERFLNDLRAGLGCPE